MDGPPAKKRKLDEVKQPDTTTQWSCPVCFDELGSPGMVPCCFTSCKGSPHLICSDCFPKLVKKVCPVCQDPIRTDHPILPLTDLVDPEDRDAQKKLTELRDVNRGQKDQSLDNLKRKIMSMTTVFSTAREERTKKLLVKTKKLESDRLTLLVNRVYEFLEKGKGDPGQNWWLTVPRPKFETAKFSGVSRADKAKSRNEFYDKIEPSFIDMFKGSGIFVCLERLPCDNPIKADHYIVIHIKNPGGY